MHLVYCLHNKGSIKNKTDFFYILFVFCFCFVFYFLSFLSFNRTIQNVGMRKEEVEKQQSIITETETPQETTHLKRKSYDLTGCPRNSRYGTCMRLIHSVVLRCLRVNTSSGAKYTLWSFSCPVTLLYSMHSSCFIGLRIYTWCAVAR